MKPIFRGVGVALVTPFTKEEVDFEAFAREIDRQITSGTDALVVLGTTGEPNTMRDAERAQVAQFCVARAAGRVPVIAGAGTNDTVETIERAWMMREAGADALLVVTPYYNKATQPGLIKHFTAIADATGLPVVLYNVPARTGLNMLPETVAQLSAHPHIVALKEAAGDIRQIDRDIALFGEKIAVYSGNDDMAFASMALGAAGVISVAANVAPELVKAYVDMCLTGAFLQARDLHRRLMRLNELLFAQISPIPTKAAMAMLGLETGRVRLPLTELSEEYIAPLKNELARLSLLPT